MNIPIHERPIQEYFDYIPIDPRYISANQNITHMRRPRHEYLCDLITGIIEPSLREVAFYSGFNGDAIEEGYYDEGTSWLEDGGRLCAATEHDWRTNYSALGQPSHYAHRYRRPAIGVYDSTEFEAMDSKFQFYAKPEKRVTDLCKMIFRWS